MVTSADAAVQPQRAHRVAEVRPGQPPPVSTGGGTPGRAGQPPRRRRAASRDQLNRMIGRITAGTWLWIGEQVSWCTGVRTCGPRSARATYEWCTSPESTLIEAGRAAAPTRCRALPPTSSGEDRRRARRTSARNAAQCSRSNAAPEPLRGRRPARRGRVGQPLVPVLDVVDGRRQQPGQRRPDDQVVEVAVRPGRRTSSTRRPAASPGRPGSSTRLQRLSSTTSRVRPRSSAKLHWYGRSAFSADSGRSTAQPELVQQVGGVLGRGDLRRTAGRRPARPGAGCPGAGRPSTTPGRLRSARAHQGCSRHRPRARTPRCSSRR